MSRPPIGLSCHGNHLAPTAPPARTNPWDPTVHRVQLGRSDAHSAPPIPTRRTPSSQSRARPTPRPQIPELLPPELVKGLTRASQVSRADPNLRPGRNGDNSRNGSSGGKNGNSVGNVTPGNSNGLARTGRDNSQILRATMSLTKRNSTIRPF